MAFDPKTPPSLIAGGIGGARGLRVFRWKSPAPISEVITEGYVRTARKLGMRPGDAVQYVDLQDKQHLLQVSYIDPDTGWGTLIFPNTDKAAYPEAETISGGGIEVVIYDAEGQQRRVALETLALESSGAISDHGILTGLGDDDHPQYLNQARGDARYPLQAGLVEQIVDAVAAALVAGTNVTSITYDDANGLITINAATQSGGGGGSGDMTKAVYDPNAKNADAFNQDNMVDGTTNKNFTATEKTKLAGVGTAASKNTGTAAGNVPLLDGAGLLDSAVLPAIAITDVFVVATQAAMLALTAQKGDIAVRSDLNKSFALSTNSPTTLADWKELLTPTDAVLSVAGLTGAISAASLKTALVLVKADVGLGNVDNTSDANKPVSTAQAAADALKSNITRTINAQTGTTYTLVLADAGSIVTMSNAAANTLTIPPNSSVAFPVGTQIDIAQKGAGKTTIAAGAGVLIGNTNKSIAAQYAGITAFKEATDTWTLYGALIA